MKIKSWLAASCSTTATTATPTTVTHLYSDTSISSNSSPATTSSSSSSITSLQSNLSIQTLPSVPSLQKLTPETLNISITYNLTASLKPTPNLQITSLSLHNNLLYAASNHIINVYDVSTLTLLHSFNSNHSSSGSVKSTVFTDSKIFTAHQDSKIRVWCQTVKNNNNNNNNSNKEYKLVTSLPSVKDRVIRCVNPNNYVSIRRHKKVLWIQHADAVTGLAVNNGYIYSVSWDRSLKIWRGNDLKCLESVNKAHDDAINAVVVSVNGIIYTGSADCKIKVWGKTEKKHMLIATLEKHKSAVNALALNDDGSVLFSGACDRSILVWEREDSANHMVVSGALRGHHKAILCLINVSDLLLSGSADRTVRIWKRGHDGKYCCLSVLEGHNKPVKCLTAVCENGSDGNKNGVVSVFSGSLDGEIKAWQVSLFRPC